MSERAYFEVAASAPFDPAEILTACVENRVRSVLIDADALPPEFFELGSGLAGELLHKLGNYRLRLAGVVPDPGVHPEHFQDFLRETNRGHQFRFFASREEAIGWLESS